MHSATYPPSRVRATGELPKIAERFDRYQSTGAEVTLADLDGEVLRCSGRPDMVRLTSRTNGALFTLTDRVGAELDPVVVLAGFPVEVRTGRSIVQGRNLVAGNNAVVFVEAFWASPGDSSRGY
jgi:hypothetical protein